MRCLCTVPAIVVQQRIRLCVSVVGGLVSAQQRARATTTHTQERWNSTLLERHDHLNSNICIIYTHTHIYTRVVFAVRACVFIYYKTIPVHDVVARTRLFADTRRAPGRNSDSLVRELDTVFHITMRFPRRKKWPCDCSVFIWMKTLLQRHLHRVYASCAHFA